MASPPPGTPLGDGHGGRLADILRERMHELSGRRGRYRVESEIGSGGVGVVYRGTALETGEPVAIKLLRDLRPDAETLRRFEQEVSLGETLNHPNLVRVKDGGRHEGVPFLVMELALGESLDHLLARRAVSLERGAAIAAKLARGLDAAHRLGIVHRDVKPGNVIVAPTGEPKLTDFGYAKDLAAGFDLTGEFVVGTPGYMAPEQVLKQTLSPRVDVWALGVLLYVIATDRLPFRGDGVEETFRLITSAELALPSRFAPGISAGLETIILRCLRKKPAERFATAEELARALESVAGSGARGPERSLVLPVLAGAIPAGLVVLGLAFYLAGPRRPLPPPSAPPPVAPSPPVAVAPPAVPVAAASSAESEDALLDRSRGEIAAFHVEEALLTLETSARAFPRSGRTRRALAAALLLGGRAGDARAAASSAEELDAASGDVFDEESRYVLSQASAVPPPPLIEGTPPDGSWLPLCGGSWTVREGILLGRGLGTGPFFLAALVRAERSTSVLYKASVEISLEDGRPGPYAGIVFGARSPSDYFAVYIFNDPDAIARGMSPERIEQFKQESGVSPKMMRVARIVDGRWEIRANTIVAFPDRGFVPLSIEASGSKATVVVSGHPSEVDLDRSLDGRGGLLKYYDTEARFRSWEWRER